MNNEFAILQQQQRKRKRLSEDEERTRLRATMDSYSRIDDAVHLREYKRARSRLALLEKRARVKHHIERFVNESAELTWPSEQEYVVALRRVWVHLMEDVCHVYDPSGTARHCSEHCRHTSAIVCVNEQLRIFGCVEHAAFHRCADGECFKRFKSGDGFEICLYSGGALAQSLSTHGASSNDFNSSSATARGWAGFTYAMSGRVADDRTVRLGAKERRTRTKNTAVDVAYRRRSAQPAATLPARTPARSDKRQSFVPRSYQEEKLMKEVREQRAREMLSLAESAIERLLFDWQRRQRLNARKEREALDKCRASVFACHSRLSTRDSVPSLLDALAHFMAPLQEVRLLPLNEPDHLRKQLLARRIFNLWNVCNSSPHARQPSLSASSSARTCTYQKFIVATLYQMRSGLRVTAGGRASHRTNERLQFLPCVPRLTDELPDEASLALFCTSDETLGHAANANHDAAYDNDAELERDELAAQNDYDTERRSRNFAEAFALNEARKQRLKLRRRKRNQRRELANGKFMCENRFLPPHWQNKRLGHAHEYSIRHITDGQKFLRACLGSLSRDTLHAAAQQLDDL